MSTSDILATIALCISILFGLPSFIRSCFNYFNKLKISITGVDFTKDGTPIIYLNLVNKTQNPISIYNIQINNNIVLLDDKSLKSPSEIFLEPKNNKTIKLICFNLCTEDSIYITLFTSNRNYKYKFQNLITQINKISL